MKTVFVLFDSLNRHVLECYGGQKVPTPNFQRLKDKTHVFDKHYAGSLPCIPARRDLLTGRLTFLHRSWGPLEPFDNAFAEILRNGGVHSHLITDHFHYWSDGGAATYHNRYTTYEFVRGQESDRWKAMVGSPVERLREKYHQAQTTVGLSNATDPRAYPAEHYDTNIVSREYIREEKDFPSVQCFDLGLEFLETNRDADNWLLQIETFDPHEPFTAPDRFKKDFDTGWEGPIRDWPRYGKVDELPEEAEELRANYYATVALCDFLLGKLLDDFDKHDMWKDTALIVTTDHGFLLGEHDFWAKSRMHLYEEIVHIPLFFHDPRINEQKRFKKLTQSIDIAPTILELHGMEIPKEMQGYPLNSKVERESLIFGYFGGAVNITDGRYTYHRFPKDIMKQELFQYTLMPTHVRTMFTPSELSKAQLSSPFPWTKNVPLLKVPVTAESPWFNMHGPGNYIESDTRLYDLETDPGQENPIVNQDVEQKLTTLMFNLMMENDAPPEAFERLDMGDMHQSP